MWTRAELKDNAKKFFKYNYWRMVLISLILTIVGGGGISANYSVNYTQNSTQNGDPFGVGGMSDSEAMAFLIGVMVIVLVVWIISAALSIFVFNPLQIGAQRFFVVSHYRKANLDELGFAFSASYKNVVKIMFLRNLYIFLWTLLFIIPGIIKTYEYLMIPYILAENPDIDSKEAFAMTKQMMTGNKWKTFVLLLSFIGWALLGGITCGIALIFYVNPYRYMTLAELYVALKEITFGGSGQGGYQDMNQQYNNQWSNNNQWNGNNQWSDNNQWNGNNQWGNNNKWNGNNQWGDNNQWNNTNQWDNSNQWNNNNGQWDNNQSGNNQWNNNQQSDDPWNNNTPS